MGTTLLPRSRRGELAQQVWRSRPDALGGRSARQAFTYDAYVPVEIASETFLFSSSIATAANQAEEAVWQLNQAELQSQLNLEALARQLLRAESVASSRIEGLVIGHRRLARAALPRTGSDPTAASVLGNIRALEYAIGVASEVDTCSLDDLCEVHRILFDGTSDERLGGQIRTEPNWIGGDGSTPRNAEFVPPPPELVEDLLVDLCAFVNRDDVPTVLQAAIAHAQFETIHPFADGNGRAGRALTLIVLRRRGAAPRYLPPVSLVLAGAARPYVAGLTSFRNASEEDWYSLFADAVYRAATEASAFADQVKALQDEWSEMAGRPRARSGARRLIELLPAHPVVDLQAARELLGGTSEQARQALQRLERAGVLQQVTVGKRNRAWETVGLFALLDDFERTLGPEDRTPAPTRH